MFQQFKNIDTSFRHVRLFSFVFMAACMAAACYISYESFKMVSQAQSRIYLLYNGKLIQAVESTRKDNIQVEVADHVKMFHHYFFTLSPDEKANALGMNQALYLADRSAKRMYDDLKESGYYTNIISGNVSQHITMDSIQLVLDQKPFYFKYYGTQKITRPTAITLRSVISEGYIRDDVARSDQNSHGFLIEKWRILENNDLETIKR